MAVVLKLGSETKGWTSFDSGIRHLPRSGFGFLDDRVSWGCRLRFSGVQVNRGCQFWVSGAGWCLAGGAFVDLFERVISTRLANPMGLGKEAGFILVMFTEVTEVHGSAMSIGSLDSSKCKNTPVRKFGPAGLGCGPHDSIVQHRVTDSGFEVRERADCWPAVIGTVGHQVGGIPQYGNVSNIGGELTGCGNVTGCGGDL